MVIDLLNFIGDEIREANPYFDKHTGVAFQTSDGRVYKFSVSDEKEFCGLSDADGIGFYVKINPDINFTQGRQITSTKQISNGTIQCTIVAYQINSDINILNWQDKIVESLKSVNFSNYLGDERHLKIEIQKTNTSPEQIFKDETGKEFEQDASIKAISVSYNLLFSSSKYNCSTCNIFDMDCVSGNVSYSLTCEGMLQKINSLPVSVKNCVVSALCPVVYEDETILFMESIGIPNDSTIYYPSTIYAKTGTQLWNYINEFVLLCKEDGTFYTDHAIYPMIGGTEQRCSYNLINPNTYQLTFVGGWTFSATGAKPNGVDAYATTGINANTVLSINNTSIGFYSGTDADELTIDIGVSDNANYLTILSNTGGAAYITVNDQGALSTPVSDTLGWIEATRTGTEKEFWKNGIKLNSVSLATVAKPNYEIVLAARNDAGVVNSFSSKEHRLTRIGEGFNSIVAVQRYLSAQKFNTLLNRNI